MNRAGAIRRRDVLAVKIGDVLGGPVRADGSIGAEVDHQGENLPRSVLEVALPTAPAKDSTVLLKFRGFSEWIACQAAQRALETEGKADKDDRKKSPEHKAPVLQTVHSGGRKFTLVKEIPGLRLHPDVLGDPTQEDQALANRLGAKVNQKGLAYLGKHGFGQYSLFAARRAGKYILLCYISEQIDDGDRHLVYSQERAEIIGEFNWYYQG